MSRENYIGMDVHQATISVAAMDASGRLIMGVPARSPGRSPIRSVNFARRATVGLWELLHLILLRPTLDFRIRRAHYRQVHNFLFARDSGRIGCLLRMRASFPDKLMQTKLSQSRPALIQNLCAKKHSVTVHAAFHSSLRPRDGKEEYAVALGFDIMRNVVIERKQPSGLHLDDLFLSVNLDLARE